MKIVVDRDLCESNGMCVDEAPEVFTIDEQSRLVVLRERLGPEHAGEVQIAVRRCPRGALSVVED